MDFPKPSPEYADLKPLTGDWGPVYGPIQSRRLGRSLGINFLGNNRKICSFDCVYCDLGPTNIRMNEIKKAGALPLKEDLIAAIGHELAKHNQNKLQIDTISVVGNGEPTLHPDFDDLTKELARLRDEYFPGVPLSILTNGANLDQRKVLAGLKYIDNKIVKLDAGSDKLVKLVNRPLVKESAESLISGARKLQGVVIQSLFVQGAVDNTKNEDIDEWMEAVGMIRPELVQIYSLDRIPAVPGLKKPDEDTLYTIAAKLEKRTRLSWKVFY